MGVKEAERYQCIDAVGEEVFAIVPHTLPPGEPPLKLEGPLAERLRRAEQALARPDLVGKLVPSPDWFVYAFVRKEAVISSQIEGAQASLIDLLNYDAGAKTEPSPAVKEI